MKGCPDCEERIRFEENEITDLIRHGQKQIKEDRAALRKEKNERRIQHYKSRIEFWKTSILEDKQALRDLRSR